MPLARPAIQIAGMWLVAVLPTLCCLLAMATAGWLNTAVGVAAALTGPLAYLIWRAPVPRAMS